MLKKIPAALLGVLTLGLSLTAGAADGPVCIRLEAKADGDLTKYSVYGEANGPIYFSGINCAIEHRNRELCAMEMVTFDTTARVYDYDTGSEIDIGKALFWFDADDPEARILAFGSREAAERYKAGIGSGAVADYTALTDSFLR